MNDKKIKKFVYNYENDILQNIDDYIYLTRNDAEKILNILSERKNKIQVVNEIVLKTGKILPLFSLQFNQYFLYNGNICGQNITNIYKNFYLKEHNETIGIYIYSTIMKCFYLQKQYCQFNNSQFYAPINLSAKQYKQLFFMLYIIFINLSKHEQMTYFFPELLFQLYNWYLSCNYNYSIENQKFMINILLKITIMDMINYYNSPIKTMMIKEKQYIYILNSILCNWLYIQKKYKKILKNESRNWISFLEKKENKYVYYKNEYISNLNKL